MLQNMSQLPDSLLDDTELRVNAVTDLQLDVISINSQAQYPGLSHSHHGETCVARPAGGKAASGCSGRGSRSET